MGKEKSMTLKAQATKEKKINWTSSKLKTFVLQGHHQKSEKIPTKWEKIYANHISDKGLDSRLYKEHLQFNNTKTNNPI